MTESPPMFSLALSREFCRVGEYATSFMEEDYPKTEGGGSDSLVVWTLGSAQIIHRESWSIAVTVMVQEICD